MSRRASHGYKTPPAWRRRLLRLVALVALAGVVYGVYTIVRDGTDAGPGRAPAIGPALSDLASSQQKLGARLEALRPGRPGRAAENAVAATENDMAAAVAVLRRRQTADESEGGALQDALGAEFDYLDAVGSVLRNRRSPLLKSLATRAQDAKDAFTALPDSEGVEDGIHGTTALLKWARARR